MMMTMARGGDLLALFYSELTFVASFLAVGVDYPNVSHVIQFGIPESREQYIHRLGRTGRGGTTGRGWLVLSDWESPFLQELKGVEIPADDVLRNMIANPMDPDSEALMGDIRNRISNKDRVLASSASGAYQAFLGYYVGQMKRMRIRGKEELVDIANDFALLSGLREPPALTKQMVGKMGLKGVSGLNISSEKCDYMDDQPRTEHRGHNDGRRHPGGPSSRSREGGNGGRRR
jgi:ATP-dependent RNA helicase MSS116, mitochondrial